MCKSFRKVRHSNPIQEKIEYWLLKKAKNLGIISGENMTTEECVVKMIGV